MALVDTIVVFVVSLLIGAAGIYVGARVVAGVDDYTYALVTALIGSLAWALLGWIPFLGPLLALLAYVAVLNYRYPGGWGKAVLIALAAWLATLAILYVLALFNVATFEAIGVPGA